MKTQITIKWSKKYEEEDFGTEFYAFYRYKFHLPENKVVHVTVYTDTKSCHFKGYMKHTEALSDPIIVGIIQFLKNEGYTRFHLNGGILELPNKMKVSKEIVFTELKKN